MLNAVHTWDKAEDPSSQIRSTKSEIRNKFKTKNSNDENEGLRTPALFCFLNFEHWIFGIVSDFDIRISELSDRSLRQKVSVFRNNEDMG